MTTQAKALQEQLRGVMAFTPTPFTAEDQVDLEGLASHVDFLCRRKVPVVVVCGGVGEFFSLTLDEYRDCIRIAVEAAARRCTVVVGVGHGTKTASELAAYSAKVGADGVMVNPTYFFTPSQRGWLEHYRSIGVAGGLGMIVFSTSGAKYSASTLSQLTEIEGVVALKDEQGDLGEFSAMVEQIGDRLAWINGMAELFAAPYAAAGAQAMTSGIVNIFPELSMRVWDAAVRGSWADVRALNRNYVRPIARMREREPGYHIAVIKEAMNILGLRGGAVRRPVMAMRDADRDELRRILEAIRSEALTPTP